MSEEEHRMESKSLACYVVGPDGDPIGIGERLHLAIQDAEARGNHVPHGWMPACHPLRSHEEVRKVRAQLDNTPMKENPESDGLASSAALREQLEAVTRERDEAREDAANAKVERDEARREWDFWMDQSLGTM